MIPGLSDAGAWGAAALALGIAELAAPGVFLVFLAVAAAVTAAAVLALPDLTPAAQAASFGVWSVVAVLVGRRWYRDYAPGEADPTLNDLGARLVGRDVVVTQAIADGRGRVRVGDGEWLAAGPDAPAGAVMRVVGLAGGVVRVARPDVSVSPSPSGEGEGVG